MQTQSKNGEGSASSAEMTGIGKRFFDTGLTKGSVYCSSPAFMHKQAQLACDNGGIMARRSGVTRGEEQRLHGMRIVSPRTGKP